MSISHSPPSWHTSSYSGARDQNCVEVAEGTTTLVRDTRHREAGHLTFGAAEWAALLDAVRADR